MHKRPLYFLVLIPLSILMATETMFSQDRVPLNPPELNRSAFPLTFEPNLGQAEANAPFLARAISYAILLESDKTPLVVPRERNGFELSQGPPSFISLELLNSDKQATSEGLYLLPGKSNYLVGSKRSKWISGIPQYGKVKFRSVYHGIDLIYYGGESGLEYDFLLSVGADPQAILFRISGADKVELDGHSDNRCEC